MAKYEAYENIPHGWEVCDTECVPFRTFLVGLNAEQAKVAVRELNDQAAWVAILETGESILIQQGKDSEEYVSKNGKHKIFQRENGWWTYSFCRVVIDTDVFLNDLADRYDITLAHKV